MSKREAVLLVSRALAVIEAVAAFLELSHLPSYLVSFLQSLEIVNFPGAPFGHALLAHLVTSSSVALAFHVLWIGVLLVLTLLFWRCGPGVINFLLPESEQPQDSGLPA
jgi:hypothetical protein